LELISDETVHLNAEKFVTHLIETYPESYGWMKPADRKRFIHRIYKAGIAIRDKYAEDENERP